MKNFLKEVFSSKNINIAMNYMLLSNCNLSSNHYKMLVENIRNYEKMQ